MLVLKDLSFRHKIPLRGSALVLATALLLTSVFGFREQEGLRTDLRENANLLAKTLGQNLLAPILQDDVWRAYELVRTPVLGHGARDRQRLPTAAIVFDRDFRVMASSDPVRFHIMTLPEDLAGMAEIAPWIRGVKAASSSELVDAGGDSLALVSEIRGDGITVGYLVLGYSRAGLRERAATLINRSLAYTLALLAVLLPVTWYWGWRMARPLTLLAESMSQVGKNIPADHELVLEESKDEIGRAGVAFRNMLVELRRKASLEREVILNERLAASGRLAAGVAHEINNPLGGMLNALDTYKRHSGDAVVVGKTLSLVERGLLQIRDAVSALLVEVRPSGTPLTRLDFEDVLALLASEIESRKARIEWEIELPEGKLPLPAALVRQVLFNLMRNALQAVPAGGTVSIKASVNDFLLKFSVANVGEKIPPDRMAVLFEPFATSRTEGHGLGLWVSYQIVQQLNGRIGVSSDDRRTVFSITIPH